MPTGSIIEWIVGRTNSRQVGRGNVYTGRHSGRSCSRLPQLPFASSVQVVRRRPALPDRSRSRAYATQLPLGLSSFHSKLLLGRWNGT